MCSLILYDSVDADPSKWFCMPHVLTNVLQGDQMYGHVLMVIPLGPDTLGYDANEQTYRLSQLNALMRNGPTPDASLDPKALSLRKFQLEQNKGYGFITPAIIRFTPLPYPLPSECR